MRSGGLHGGVKSPPLAFRILQDPRSHMALVIVAVAYQQTFFTENEEQLRFRGVPVVGLATGIFAFAYLLVGSVRAALIGCVLLVLVAAERCCVTLVAPLHVLHEQLSNNSIRPQSPVLCWFCLGTALGAHPHIRRKTRLLTLLATNGTYAVRMVVWYARTAERWSATSLLLYVTLPFCAAFWMASMAKGLLRRPPAGAEAHAASEASVDNDCTICADLFATDILMPCGLGVCPQCLVAARMVDPELTTCPRCREPVTHVIAIRHCDMHEKEV